MATKNDELKRATQAEIAAVDASDAADDQVAADQGVRDGLANQLEEAEAKLADSKEKARLADLAVQAAVDKINEARAKLPGFVPPPPAQTSQQTEFAPPGGAGAEAGAGGAG